MEQVPRNRPFAFRIDPGDATRLQQAVHFGIGAVLVIQVVEDTVLNRGIETPGFLRHVIDGRMDEAQFRFRHVQAVACGLGVSDAFLAVIDADHFGRPGIQDRMIEIAVAAAHVDYPHPVEDALMQIVEAQPVVVTRDPLAVLIGIELDPQRLEQIVVLFLHGLIARVDIQRQAAVAEGDGPRRFQAGDRPVDQIVRQLERMIRQIAVQLQRLPPHIHADQGLDPGQRHESGARQIGGQALQRIQARQIGLFHRIGPFSSNRQSTNSS